MSWECRPEGVSARWGTETVLEGVDLTIPCGRLGSVPLMGPSGAGKSTLLYLMAALKWPETGSVSWTFPHHEPFTWNAAGLRDEVAVRLRRELFGFAFQDSTLSAHLTVEENLTYPLAWRSSTGSEVRDRVSDALKSTLLEDEEGRLVDFMGRFSHQLSGGQRQRVALAQAGIHNPRVLFADEPAGNLDLATRRQIMEMLRHWIGGRGERALVWVTHHADDPALMGVDELIWVEGRKAEKRTSSWLETWSRESRRDF